MLIRESEKSRRMSYGEKEDFFDAVIGSFYEEDAHGDSYIVESRVKHYMRISKDDFKAAKKQAAIELIAKDKEYGDHFKKHPFYTDEDRNTICNKDVLSLEAFVSIIRHSPENNFLTREIKDNFKEDKSKLIERMNSREALSSSETKLAGFLSNRELGGVANEMVVKSIKGSINYGLFDKSTSLVEEDIRLSQKAIFGESERSININDHLSTKMSDAKKIANLELIHLLAKENVNDLDTATTLAVELAREKRMELDKKGLKPNQTINLVNSKKLKNLL